jgi:hypothetical protein
MSIARKYVAAAPLGGGRVLVAGGYTSGNPTKSAEILGTSDAFTARVKGKKLIATVSSSGTLSVLGATAGATAAKKKKKPKRLLKPSTATGGPGEIRLKLKLTKAANAKLRHKGKLKVRAAVTFEPDAGFAGTRTLKLKLK